MAILLGVAIACCGLAASAAQRAQPHARSVVAKPRVARPARGHAPGVATRSRLQFRPSRGAAAGEAARLGALAGNGCAGRADMQRGEHEWVVLCANGKTYVVGNPPQATPPTECSLAGIGPEPACFP